MGHATQKARSSRGDAAEPNERNLVPMNPVRVHDGVMGGVLAAGILLIALLGIPEARWFAVVALAAGAAVGLALWLKHR